MIQKIKSNRVLIVLYIIIAAFIVHDTFVGVDNDFFHIAQSGKELLSDASYFYENKHFVKEGYENLIQQWLYSILLYKSFDIGGMAGVTAFTVMQYVLFLFVTYKYLTTCKVKKQLALISSLIIPLSMIDYISCRPQMISVILFILQFIVVEKYRQTQKPRVLYWLPILMLLEVNLHLTFGIFHIIFLLPFLVPIPAIKSMRDISDNLPCKSFIVPMILSLVAMLINPYTYQSFTLLLESKGISALAINELQSLSVFSEGIVAFLIGIFLFIVLIIKKKVTSTSVWLLSGTAILYAIALRNMIFYTLAILYLLKEVLLLAPDTTKFWKWFNDTVNAKVVSAIVIISTLIFGISIKAVDGKSVKAFTPDSIIEYMKQHETNLSEIKMFTPFDTGAYFVWNGIGHIYLEPKTEPYIKAVNKQKDVISEYCFIEKYADANSIKDFLEEYQFDYLFIDERTVNLGTYLSASNEYECVIQSESKSYDDYEYSKFRLFHKIK